jgi:NADP-dependent aldehyde dehydrogenase
MIQGFDPRTGEPVGEPVAETTDAGVDAIVAAALAAAPAWGAGTALARRAAALEAVADALDDRAGELAVIADTETALGGERLAGEVARTTLQLRLFAGVLRDGGGDAAGRPPAPRYLDAVVSPAEGVVPDVRRISRPVGPVAVFAASNFPFAFSVAGGDTASALAAGCPVVVKAHEGHPVTSDVTAEVVTQALASAGAPAGTFGLVHGVEAGLRLLRHRDIAAAGFTGSTAGGLALARICAERPVPIPFYGELGSVNPCVVLPGAASSGPAAIAAGYAGSLTLGAGQFCTNPGLLFVPEDAGLVSAIVEAVTASAGAPMLSGRIFAGYEDAVAEAEDHPAVTALAAGRPGPGPWGATPRVFQLTLKEFAADLAALSRERFGPAGLVITYPSAADLLPVLAALAGNLVATVHADPGSPGDLDLARQVIAVLERVAGRIVFNGWPTGVAVVAAQHHGGPWPATTAPAYTSVGTAAIRRWLVPVAYQDFPAELLPPGLQSATQGHRCER